MKHDAATFGSNSFGVPGKEKQLKELHGGLIAGLDYKSLAAGF